MNHFSHQYLVHIQYLGFRYHGWAKQPKQRTIHQAVDKTLTFVFDHEDFKTMGASRTDAMVSAEHAAFELFVNEPIDENDFLASFNKNGPSDIKALSIESVDKAFNIIRTPKVKEYVYLFASEEKVHPFCVSLLTAFPGGLDIPLMQEGARLFEGTHNFKKYCTKPSANTQFTREILKSEIVENTLYTANFFPEQSYIYRIQGRGFLRYQVRLMMGQLVELGKHNITLDDIKQSLSDPDDQHLRTIVPASGLKLHHITFEDL